MLLLTKQNNGKASVHNFSSPAFDADKFLNLQFPIQHRFPAVNILENKTHFLVEVAVPGFKKQDFNVTVKNGVLNISGEMNPGKMKIEKSYRRYEFNCSSFSRYITLPYGTSKKKIQMKYENGILNISIGKLADASAAEDMAAA